MRLLVHVDGSPWASLALQHAARRLDPGDEVVLLAVCPRGSEGYLECGRMVIEAAQRACAGMLAQKKVRTRLAVGDPRKVVPTLAAAEQVDLVVMGPPDPEEARTHPRGYFFPREADRATRPIESLVPGDLRQAVSSRCECPILTGSPGALSCSSAMRRSSSRPDARPPFHTRRVILRGRASARVSPA
jgi:nucleotide-binding universal stress UspA family protein